MSTDKFFVLRITEPWDASRPLPDYKEEDKMVFSNVQIWKYDVQLLLHQSKCSKAGWLASHIKDLAVFLVDLFQDDTADAEKDSLFVQVVHPFGGGDGSKSLHYGLDERRQLIELVRLVEERSTLRLSDQQWQMINPPSVAGSSDSVIDDGKAPKDSSTSSSITGQVRARPAAMSSGSAKDVGEIKKGALNSSSTDKSAAKAGNGNGNHKLETKTEPAASKDEKRWLRIVGRPDWMNPFKGTKPRLIPWSGHGAEAIRSCNSRNKVAAILAHARHKLVKTDIKGSDAVQLIVVMHKCFEDMGKDEWTKMWTSSSEPSLVVDCCLTKTEFVDMMTEFCYDGVLSDRFCDAVWNCDDQLAKLLRDQSVFG